MQLKKINYKRLNMHNIMKRLKYTLKNNHLKVAQCLFVFAMLISSHKLHAQAVQYTTTANGLEKFKTSKLMPTGITNTENNMATIQMDMSKNFQTIEGFGFALTGGSAALIDQLAASKKQALLQEIFGKGKNDLGVNYIRISIGASDLDANVFSYYDLPKGTTDSLLLKFNLSEDTLHLIPILKKALAINPSLKIMASPWSPPIWMKSNGASMGGHLLKQYYATYAHYFVKYIKAMEQKGIPIASVTLQNEPEHGGNNPSLLMDAQEQTQFLANYIGPQFKAANIKTEVILYDHNADHPNYPIAVLNDSVAKSYASGTAFHLYLGHESALSQVHDAHPTKKIYFTEQWTGAKGEFGGDLMWHLEHVVVGTINNWSSAVIEWNLAADASFNPHTPGGCSECKGAFTIQGNDISRNVSYYIIGQASKYIPVGAKRVAVQCNVESIKCTGFMLPNGKKANLIVNTGGLQKVKMQSGTEQIIFEMPAQSVSTIVW
jgi:glucosylceramidase